MPKAQRNVPGQRELKVIEGRVLALSCHETCCVYVVTDDNGYLSEVKQYYVQSCEGVNIEDGVR
jgi:hypothetical protein